MSQRHTPTILAALCLLAPSARAEAPKPPVQTLAQALAQAATPKSEFYLTVDADKVALPKDAAPAAPGADIAQVAAVFGRTVGVFGSVEALAPATITVVNVPPEKPNPYDGMEPKRLIKMLTSQFSADQWKAFLSAGGLGYLDMTTDWQRALFEALFPDHHMSLGRYGADEDEGPVKEVSGDALKPAHLRLAFRTTMALSIPNDPGTYMFSNEYVPASRPTPYVMRNSPAGDVDREYGAVVRTTVENTLKPSDFGDKDAALRSEVFTGGIKTVDDAVRKVSAAAGREIYADPRYAKKTLTMIGAPRSVPAMDLLQALALCLGATYRQVGNAYVLTDDLIGLGAKHQLWKEFEDKAKQMQAARESQDSRRAPSDIPYTLRDIPWTDDAYPLTPQQQEDNWPTWRDSEIENDLIQVILPFALLSPAQQEAARQIQALNAKDQTNTTLAGDIMLQSEPIVEIILPSLDAPVLVFESFNGLLPYVKPSPEEQREEALRLQMENNPNFVTLKLGPVKLRPFGLGERIAHTAPPAKPLKIFSRSAVRIAPRSLEELTEDLDAMKSLAIGELWLSITPGTDEQDDASLALLHQAVPLARERNIAVYPDVSLFVWSGQRSEALLDRTITGRTSLEQDAMGDTHAANIQDTVSRFDPEVGRRLGTLIGKASREPGVAGIVWENQMSAGYERLESNEALSYRYAPTGAKNAKLDHGSRMSSAMTLGYAVPGRLANLRKNHVDPIDLHDNTYTDKRAHTRVPGFDDDTSLESLLCADWRRLCIEWNLGLLRSLTGALPRAFAPGPRRSPVLLLPMNSSNPTLYGSWDNFSLAPSDAQYIYPQDARGKSIPGTSGKDQMASELAYDIVSDDLNPNAANETVDGFYASALQRLAQSGAHAVVFDAVRRPALLTQLRDAEAAHANAKRPEDPK